MNTAALSKYYRTLTPWERLPLLLSASLREDTTEYERLGRSAPQHSFGVPDYLGLLEGFLQLAQEYLLQQLDTAASSWRLSAYLEQETAFADLQSQQQEERLWNQKRWEAYRFVVRADGWKQLCAELHIDSDRILEQLPGYENVCVMERQARLFAYSAEEAASYFREVAGHVRSCQHEAVPAQTNYPLDTAADVARALRGVLQERLRSWT